MVGHPYGNIAIVYYMLQHGSDTSLPKLVKQVDIAGHFNGIIGMDEREENSLDGEGKPTSMTESYEELLSLLLKGHVKSYQEKEITGPNGQHSKHHETALVDKPLNAFLWGK